MLKFEFKDMTRAEEFVAVVTARFGLAGFTFDDMDATLRTERFIHELDPPIVYVERAFAKGDHSDAWFEIERAIEALAPDFGGHFMGT